jgi:hypothetical protein
MKRRTFLGSGLAAGSFFALGGGGWWLCRRITPEYLLKVLDQAFAQPDDLVRVGRVYLETVPSENDRQHLGSLLAERFTARRAFQIENAIREVIQEDFAIDQVVELEGWILSRTEVRLCALAALAV